MNQTTIRLVRTHRGVTQAAHMASPTRQRQRRPSGRASSSNRRRAMRRTRPRMIRPPRGMLSPGGLVPVGLKASAVEISSLAQSSTMSSSQRVWRRGITSSVGVGTCVRCDPPLADALSTSPPLAASPILVSFLVWRASVCFLAADTAADTGAMVQCEESAQIWLNCADVVIA